MLKPRKAKQVVWSSSLVAVLAVAGALLGFAQTGSLVVGMFEHGGSAFLLVYVIALLLFGVPVMLAWLFLGRRTDQPSSSVIDAARASNLSRFWGWLGPFWQLLSFLLFVLVVAWAGEFAEQLWTAPTVGASPAITGVALFAVLVWLLGIAGRAWLGRLSALLVLVLVGGAIVLLIDAKEMHTLQASWVELFAFRFQLLDWSALLQALQLALVSCSLGGAALWVYASYIPAKPASLAAWSGVLLLVETLLALLIGFSSFAVTSAIPLESGQLGALPLVIPVIASLIAAAALAEAVTVRIQALGINRPFAWTLVVLVATLFGMLKSASQWLDWLQPVVLHWLLPLAILLAALLVGWMLKETRVRKVLSIKSFPVYLSTRALLRLWVPLVVLVLLAHEAGWC